MDKLWHTSYAPGVPHNIDYDEITLPEALTRSREKYPKNTALIFQGYTVTYEKLDEMVNRLAAAYIDMGVKKGDRIAILLPNLIQCVVAFYAALRIGAIVVMNNPLYSDRELEHQLNNSESVLLVCLDLLAPRMIALKPKTKVKNIIVTGIGDYLPFPKSLLFPLVAKKKGMKADVPQAENVHFFKKVLAAYPPTPIKADIAFSDTALFQYTGGTTGVSKGVMLSHENLCKNVQMLKAWFPTFTEGGEIGIAVLPFFHVFGLTCVMNFCIYMGWADILIPRPEPSAILDAVTSFKPTFFPAVPTMYIGLLAHPDTKKSDLKSIKGCFSGSAPLPVEVIKEFESMTGAKIVEGFGLTESTPVTHINPFGGITKIGSIGVPLPDTDCRIVDLDDEKTEVKQGNSGELIISGPQVMQGYYNMPDETKGTLRDGWLYTGDVATMDEDGYFYIVDRKKDMIIAGGYNIYPREIDEVLYEHPKVQEACAVGVPDEYRGETVKVFIVPKPGETMTGDEIISYCKEKLAKYKVPKLVEFRDSLPKSTVGKVLRKELRAQEIEKQKKS
ncbi:MAG: long-chain fatty acid--CoA ligase [Deltaproteobacteria bacterium]|nr:long-chain fatty acid--CoA ligase [Candidatus Zymogenaceae bacterium]